MKRSSSPNRNGIRNFRFENIHQNWEIAGSGGRVDFLFANRHPHPPFQDPCLGMTDSQRCINYPERENYLWTLDTDEFLKIAGTALAARISCGSNELVVFKPPLRFSTYDY